MGTRVSPKPLDVGVWHRVENVVPARGPLNQVVFLEANRIRIIDLQLFLYFARDAEWLQRVAPFRPGLLVVDADNEKERLLLSKEPVTAALMDT